eukprot:760722-Hanusia_phi.AAC.2
MTPLFLTRSNLHAFLATNLVLTGDTTMHWISRLKLTGTSDVIVVLKERAEQLDAVLDVVDSDGFPDAVHAQGRDPNINSADAGACRHDWSDGAAAWAIVAHNELLHIDAGTPCELPDDKPSGDTRGIPLVGVRLDHSPLVEQGPVIRLVLAGVVWVHGVGHVCGNDEGFLQGDLVVLDEVCRVVPVVHTFDELLDDRASSSMRTGGTDFFMVEANDGGHIRILLKLWAACVFDKSLKSCETVSLVVQPGGAEELVFEAPDLLRLGVIQGQVKIPDSSGRATKFLRKSRQKFWSMARVRSLTGRLVQLFVDHGKDRH